MSSVKFDIVISFFKLYSSFNIDKYFLYSFDLLTNPSTYLINFFRLFSDFISKYILDTLNLLFLFTNVVLLFESFLINILLILLFLFSLTLLLENFLLLNFISTFLLLLI